MHARRALFDEYCRTINKEMKTLREERERRAREGFGALLEEAAAVEGRLAVEGEEEEEEEEHQQRVEEEKEREDEGEEMEVDGEEEKERKKGGWGRSDMGTLTYRYGCVLLLLCSHLLLFIVLFPPSLPSLPHSLFLPPLDIS